MKCECLSVEPGKTLSTLSVSDFKMPTKMDANLHPFLTTLWAEAYLAWVKDNEHKMTRGEGRHGESGLLYNKQLCGYASWVTESGSK